MVNNKDGNMNLVEASLLILLLAAFSAPLAERFHLPGEVFLLLGSCVLSLIPGIPIFEINPNIVFIVFLPPILFYAAYLTSWRDFKRNRRPIAFLAIGLVIITTGSVAWIAKLIFPNFTWAQGFLLGAIVSPPDAAAATSIVRKLRAPRRLITLLEGESLVNDATALLAYRFALSAILIGSFSFGSAIGQFFIMTIGGILVGFVISFTAFQFLRRLADGHAQTTMSLVTAFACYIAAEHLGVSSVISTVVGGFYFGRRFPELTSSRARIETNAAWKHIIFIINGFVFSIMGFQLPIVLKTLGDVPLWTLIIDSVGIAVVVIAVRLAWVFTATYIPRLLSPVIRRNDPNPSWQVVAALGWTGMRGIVSLAAVLAIPTELPNGLPFPDRGILIFVTYVVILITLIVPSLTLPWWLNFFKIKGGHEKVEEEAIARVRALEGVLNRIKSWEENQKFPPHMVSEFKQQMERKLSVIRPHVSEVPFSEINEEYSILRKLTKESLESERAVLHQLRREGKIHDEVFHLLSEELDLEEIRCKTLRI